MICNIVDKRTNAMRWKSVDVVIEATQYDNSVPNSDQVEASVPDDLVLVDTLDRVSIAEAVQWAEEVEHPVTLFIYDAGANSDPDE